MVEDPAMSRTRSKMPSGKIAMRFGEYVKRYKDAGYTILESKNEVDKGRSRHATGDHWHIVLREQPMAILR